MSLEDLQEDKEFLSFFLLCSLKKKAREWSLGFWNEPKSWGVEPGNETDSGITLIGPCMGFLVVELDYLTGLTGLLLLFVQEIADEPH